MIRMATLDDAGAVAAVYRPYVESTVISFEVVPPTADEMRGRIRAVLERCPWLVDEDDGQVVGYAYASAHHARAAYQWSVDTAVYVHQDCHRRGIGRQLYAAAVLDPAAAGIRECVRGNHAAEREERRSP